MVLWTGLVIHGMTRYHGATLARAKGTGRLVYTFVLLRILPALRQVQRDAVIPGGGGGDEFLGPGQSQGVGWNRDDRDMEVDNLGVFIDLDGEIFLGVYGCVFKLMVHIIA